MPPSSIVRSNAIAAVMEFGYAQHIQTIVEQISAKKLPINLVVDSKDMNYCLATEPARDPLIAFHNPTGDVHLFRE